jgi:hypothetical protein
VPDPSIRLQVVFPLERLHREVRFIAADTVNCDRIVVQFNAALFANDSPSASSHA